MRAVIAAAWASITRAAAPSASADQPTRLPVSVIPASSPTRAAALANGTAAAARAAIFRSSGDITWPVAPSSASRGARPCPHWGSDTRRGGGPPCPAPYPQPCSGRRRTRPGAQPAVRGRAAVPGISGQQATAISCPSRLPCLTGSFKQTANTHLRLCLGGGVWGRSPRRHEPPSGLVSGMSARPDRALQLAAHQHALGPVGALVDPGDHDSRSRAGITRTGRFSGARSWHM